MNDLPVQLFKGIVVYFLKCVFESKRNIVIIELISVCC